MYEEYYVLTFDSTHLAMAAENALKHENLSPQIIPLPTQISAGCGLSIKISKDNFELAMQILAFKKVSVSKVFFARQTGLNKKFEAITQDGVIQ